MASPSVPPSLLSAVVTDTLPLRTRLEELEIERVLCVSAYGVVYLASDRTLDLRVAVKEYLPGALAMHGTGGQVVLRATEHGEAFERGRAAFIGESRTLARCDHASLLRVHRVWETNGTVYRVMPYYAGQNLLGVRQGMSHAPNSASLRALLEALLGALETLHAVGGVHGEVAPGNILLLPDDRPLLLGFGAARRALLAEPAYVAAAGAAAGPAEEPQGPWTDLRALAAVARYCLSGTAAAPDHGGIDPLAGASDRTAESSPPADESRCDAPTRAVLAAMRAAGPDDPPNAAARCRALLHRPSGWAAGGAGPASHARRQPETLRAVSADGVAPTPIVAEPNEDKFIAELEQVIAATARQVQLRERAAAMRAAASPAVAPSSPGRSKRSPLAWGAAAVVALAIAAAGWNSSQDHAADAGERTSARRSDPVVASRSEPAGDIARAGEHRAVPSSAWAPAATVPTRSGAQAPPSPEAGRTPVAQTPAVATGLAPAARASPAESGPPEPARAAASPVSSPREECGDRTPFALYRCMQAACAQARWIPHAQCARLRATDEID